MLSIKDHTSSLRSEKEILSNWGNSERVKVTICCIVFNHFDFVEEAIKSFLMQETDFPFEIIIHDDASTDASATVIEKYVKLYPNLIKPIYQSENIYSKGIKPLSIIFSQAKGDYFAICEGDDYWLDKNKIQKQYDYMSENLECSVSYHRSLLIENGELTDKYSLNNKCYKDFDQIDLLKGRGRISTQTAMLRSNIKHLPEEYSMVTNEDSFLFVLCGEFGVGKFLEEIGPSAYRLHNGGIWSNKKSSMKSIKAAESYYWIAKYYERVGKKHFSSFFLFKSIKTILLSSIYSPLYNLLFMLKVGKK
ncbi:glycosyltransferase family 2 protein [Pseudoalteromonas sp. PAB 2.2]|uniref:glycosyltransferase family 2 protein n=1 Tax=Pseudoalteromonas sp. PAB 2.2 TaxID=1841508 RepID=UPI00094FD0D5|nr:glycosyltransferase [Pseudoalteromonas sp. PAB 2.2]